MNTITGHLSRRGVELASQLADNDHKMPEDVKVSPVGIVFVVLSVVIMAVVLGLVDYTLNIVLTLTALEDTTKSVALVTDPTKPKDTANLMDPELVVLQQTPITSKIRTTIRHLHREAGWTSRWRGMSLAICYHLVHSILMGLFLRIFGGADFSRGMAAFSWSHLVNIAGNIVASVVLARWAITWTHVVLTSPDRRPWFRRVPAWSAFRKVLMPTAFAAFVFGIMSMYIVLFVALVIPAEVSLMRMQASLLPEDAETIIPFDASFGGKVVPEALGGKGYLTFMDSWRTFDRESRRRFLKMVIKTTLVSFALAVCFVLILATQVSFVAWDAIRDLLEKNGQQSL